MKNLKKVIDLNSRQFVQALTRNGITFATADKTKVNVGFGSIVELVGKTLRAQLAQALRDQAKAAETIENQAFAGQPEPEVPAQEIAKPDHDTRGKEAYGVNETPEAPKAPVASTGKTKACPKCGAEIPSRYRVCDNCLKSKGAAKSAAPAATPESN